MLRARTPIDAYSKLLTEYLNFIEIAGLVNYSDGRIYVTGFAQKFVNAFYSYSHSSLVKEDLVHGSDAY